MPKRASLSPGFFASAGWITAFILQTLLAQTLLAQERVWTDATGRTLRGEFVREVDGEVTILVDGKLSSLPLDRLSDRDQQIVRDLAAGKEVPLDSDTSPAVEKPRREPDASERPPSLTKKRPKPIASRVWTELSGRKSTGKFVRIFEAKVVIARAGGPLQIGFYELSDADQTYVREILEARGEEGMIPDRPIAGSVEGGGDMARGPLAGMSGPPGFGPAGFGPPPDSGPRGFGPPGLGPPGFEPRVPPTFDSVPSAPGFMPPPGTGFSGESAFDAQQRMLDAQASASREMASTVPPSAYLPPDTDSMFKQVPICSACGKQVSDTAATGQRCPHCKAYWAFNTYNGSKSGDRSAAGGSAVTGGGAVGGRKAAQLFGDGDSERHVRTAIIVISALVAVVVLIAGVIGVAVAIASAARSSRQYRQY